MNDKANIEDLFRQALEQAEMPVDPAIWQGVSAGIGAGSAGAAAATGGWSLITKLLVGAGVAGALVAGTLAFLPDSNLEVTQAEVEQPVSEEHNEIETETSTENAQPQQPIQESPLAVEEEVDEEIEPFDELPASSSDYDDVNADRAPEASDAPALEQPSFEELEPSVEVEGATDEPATPVVSEQVQEVIQSSGDHRDPSPVSTDEEELVSEATQSRAVIPNVFTPNGDGFNDVLDLEALSIACELEYMQVQSASGDLLFSASESVRTWDGNDLYGNRCVPGKYLVTYRLIGEDGVTHQDAIWVTLR